MDLFPLFAGIILGILFSTIVTLFLWVMFDKKRKAAGTTVQPIMQDEQVTVEAAPEPNKVLTYEEKQAHLAGINDAKLFGGSHHLIGSCYHNDYDDPHLRSIYAEAFNEGIELGKQIEINLLEAEQVVSKNLTQVQS